ncbi:hypothetical protein O3M35_008011 [Rhynocoris fuscipes]|uniref:Arrestin C-terminal-like domain-containing protein n=1 Tax=Rhynocoris fuscipes TaxID=488301 RepID=A0AAW1DAP5_9HEMI
MHVRKFCISLDDPEGCYCTGSRLTGRILLWLNKTKDIRGIKIKFGGKAHVSWQNTEHRNQFDERKRSKEVFYSGRERYVNYEFFIVGGDHSKISIAGGYEQAYPFYIDIPAGIPSSFRGKYGYIRYTITARLVKNWIFDTKEKIPIEVYSPKDLNCYPSAGLPVNRKEEKTFFTVFHSTQGPLIMNASLPQTGFVTEQDIPLTVQIINNSSLNVDSIEVKIMKVTQWKVHLPRSDSRNVKTELANRILPGVSINETKKFLEIFNCGHFYIPNLDACSIINESFYIKVKACVHSIYRKGIKIKIPIMFGTVPVCNQQYRNSISSYSEFGSNYDLTSSLPPDWNPELANQFSTLSEQYISIDPPPYSVAISMPAVSPQYYSTPPIQTWTSPAVVQPNLSTNESTTSSTDKPVISYNKSAETAPSAPPQYDN